MLEFDRAGVYVRFCRQGFLLIELALSVENTLIIVDDQQMLRVCPISILVIHRFLRQNL